MTFLRNGSTMPDLFVSTPRYADDLVKREEGVVEAGPGPGPSKKKQDRSFSPESAMPQIYRTEKNRI